MSIFSALKTRKSFHHLNLSNAKHHYVNKNGNDALDGLTPETAKLTITAGINSLNPGDRLIVGFGNYYEDIDINVDYMQMLCEWGVIIFGTITISANITIIDTVRVIPSSGNAYNITGNLNFINNCTASSGVIGFNLTGSSTLLVDCYGIGQTQTSFDISNFNIILLHCASGGNGGNTRGFYFSDPAGHDCLLEDCLSNNNALAGFELVDSCEFNSFKNCISGSGDGKKIDNNDTNIWVNFQDELPSQHSESVYPIVSGEGISSPPIIISNLTTNDLGGTRSDQNFWGDVIRIIPKNEIIEEYKFYGINIYAVTANKDLMWELFFTNGIEASQSGGNDWDLNETILTVDDASDFEIDDWIWLNGDDRLDGEILKISNIASNVITIVRETTASAGTGLRYDYDISPGNNKIHLVHRPTYTIYSKIDSSFSASSSKDFKTYLLFKYRLISANAAALMRMSNGTDSLSVSFEARARIEK